MALGGESVLYVATALAAGTRSSKSASSATASAGRAGGGRSSSGGDLGAVLEAAQQWEAVVLLDLTLWVSARMPGGEEETLRELDLFLEGATALGASLILVSDEVGLGVVPESERKILQDLLGLANQRAAAAAEEVHLCVAGIGMRVK